MNAVNHGSKFVELTELNLGDTILVEMGNPGDADYEPEAELVVLQIHRTHNGWMALGERDHKNRDGVASKQLCAVRANVHWEGNTPVYGKVPYNTTMGLTVGNRLGETREIAIANLHFAPE